MSGVAWSLGLASGLLVALARALRAIGHRSQPEASAARRHSSGHAATQAPRRPAAPERQHPRPAGAIAVTVIALTAIVAGTGAAIVGALGLGGAWLVHRRQIDVRRRRKRDAVVPDLVDLFALAASAGLPVATALPVVAERAPPALRPALSDAAGHLARGGTTAEALAGLHLTLGPQAEPLVDALAAAARTGTALGPALASVSAAAHHQRARAAEEAARRLPVTLLFPLACCILPAAVLLALVPVLVASLGSLAG